MESKVATSWQSWKSVFAPLLQGADMVGLSEEMLTAFADRVGDFLASYVDPKSPEQRMLKELWDVASSEEQRVLAKLIIRAIKEVKKK